MYTEALIRIFIQKFSCRQNDIVNGGLTYGGILGIVFIVSRKYLPSSNDKNEAIALAAIICLSLYVVPLIDYPVNIPTVEDFETIGLRDSL